MTDDLVAKLRDEDSYYRLQEKHWCIDAEELERQRLAAADRIEALEAENERLREALRELVEEYVHNVDSTRLGGFYLNPETEDCVIDARAALKGSQQ